MKTDAIVRRDWKELVEARGGTRYVHDWAPQDIDITEDLVEAGVEVRPYKIDLDAFEAFMVRCGYRELDYWKFLGEVGHSQRLEKCLEHFVSIDLMNPRSGEVMVDVASCHSPFSSVMAEHYGVRAFRQDYMLFPPGIHGDCIGGDASAFPVGDDFANMATLHCSYEHLEGNRDSFFLKEANRILKPGGRLCILPLYLSDHYSIQSDPLTWSEWPVMFDPEAVLYLAKGWGQSFGRMYDVEAFKSRFLDHLGDLELVLYNVQNAEEVDSGCHLRTVAMLTKPRKRARKGAKGRSPKTNAKPMVNPEVRLFSEAAELRHELHMARLQATENFDRIRKTEGYLEGYRRELASADSGALEARRVYEAQISRLERVVEEQRAGIDEREVWLGDLKADLTDAQSAHGGAATRYENEVSRLSEVVIQLRQALRERDGHFINAASETARTSRLNERSQVRLAAEVERLSKMVGLQDQQIQEQRAEHQELQGVIEHFEAQDEELRVDLEGQSTAVRDSGFKAQDLEDELELARRNHIHASECYEAEINKVLKVTDLMEQQLQDRDNRLAAYGEQLEKAYVVHQEACLSYEKENAKMAAVVVDSQKKLQERDDYIVELIEQLNSVG